MQMIDMLKRKNVKVIEVQKWGTYLKKQWADSFASHMSLQEKEAIYLYDEDGSCGYLWHLFSYGKKDHLAGETAERAFNIEQKNTCYVFYQHKDDALILEEAPSLNADDFIGESDIYIVDKDFSWTYVQTHETGWCGPYFSRRD